MVTEADVMDYIGLPSKKMKNDSNRICATVFSKSCICAEKRDCITLEDITKYLLHVHTISSSMSDENKEDYDVTSNSLMIQAKGFHYRLPDRQIYEEF